MNPLLHVVAAQAVNAQDALRMAEGASWQDLWIRNVWGASWSGETRIECTPKVITILKSPDGAGKVTWAEVAEMIRAGLTEQLTDDLRAAVADWGTFNHDPANRGDLTYASCTDRFRELEQQIIANALGSSEPAQLSFFDLLAS